MSLKGARGMGKVLGEGEGGRREDKKCKAKGWKAAGKRQRELNQKKKEKEGKCLKDGTVGKSKIKRGNVIV